LEAQQISPELLAVSITESGIAAQQICTPDDADCEVREFLTINLIGNDRINLAWGGRGR